MGDIFEDLKHIEKDIDLKCAQMARLKSEYSLNLQNLYLTFAPKSQPLRTALYQFQRELSEVKLRILYLESKVVRMETRKTNFLESRDMAESKKGMLDALKPDLEDAFLALESVTKEELAVLRGYENPPTIVLDTMDVVSMIREEPPEVNFEGCKVMLSETYYYSFFVSKCRSKFKTELSPEQFNKLKKFVWLPEAAPDAIATASRPCAAMSRWLHALYDFALITTITAPRPNETLTQTKEQLFELRVRGEQAKADTMTCTAKLEQLQVEQHAKVAELRDRYDQTMIPLQDMFFEANQRYNEVYCSPRRRNVTDATEEEL